MPQISVFFLSILSRVVYCVNQSIIRIFFTRLEKRTVFFCKTVKKSTFLVKMYIDIKMKKLYYMFKRQILISEEEKMMGTKTKRLIVIGAGSRGRRYTDISKQMGERFEVVAVAEPIAARRQYIQTEHLIPDELCFESWEPLLALPKMADAALICTMDRDHLAPALTAIRAGYDLLLEKPVCPTPEECYLIEREAKKYGTKVLVCHVLRYTPFFRTIKKLIDDGTLGRVINIQHREDVGHIHQSHSFVRGNWGNSEESSFMLLQKSCHDMDILQWLLGKKCTKVQSFGSLTYFTPENAPEGAPAYCLDGCPAGDTCPYNAAKIYLSDKCSHTRREAVAKTIDPTKEEIENALRTTQYGKCVYQCNNNVVDHQVVNLEFEDQTTVTFSMCAFNKGGRELRIMGTKGELCGRHGDKTLRFFEFATGNTLEIPAESGAVDQSIEGGHGGGDTGIMYAFYDLLSGIENFSLCDLPEAVDNHMIAFAAEEARVTGSVIDLNEFKERKRNEI